MLKSFKLLNVETAHRSKHLKEGYKHFIAGNKRLFRNSAEYKRQIKKRIFIFSILLGIYETKSYSLDKN